MQRLFREHQLQILFSYRFLYGLRVIIPIVIGMSHIKPVQYLFYSVASGLIWASTVGTVGYFVGRFFNLRASVFEENILFVVLAFASFGVGLGYALNYLARKNFKSEQVVGE